MGNLIERLSREAFFEKQEELRALLTHIDGLISSIQINTFRYRDDDLEPIKEDLVLQNAQDLQKAVKEARRLQKELNL